MNFLPHQIARFSRPPEPFFTESEAETDEGRKWVARKWRCSNDADSGKRPSFEGTESEALYPIKNIYMGESYLCILSGNKSIHVLSYFFLTCAF
jgi:hypothetical protein